MVHVISRDGTPIAYDRRGSGPVIILVGGATKYRAADPLIGPKLLELLSPSFTVINYDRRGRGESGDVRPYAVAREVEDIEALVTEFGGEAFLFGMSSGAVLALEAAAAMPRKIKAVALYEPYIDPSRSSLSYQDEYLAMATLAAEGRRSEMLEAFLVGIGIPAESIHGFRESPAWPIFAAIAPTIAYDYRITAEARRSDKPPVHWQNAIMPVLILNGDKSYPFLGPGADWVASGLHNAQRITLADQAHECDPAVVAPVINVFFEQGSVQVH